MQRTFKDFQYNQVRVALVLVRPHLNLLFLDRHNQDYHLQKSIFEMDQNHYTLQGGEIDPFG